MKGSYILWQVAYIWIIFQKHDKVRFQIHVKRKFDRKESKWNLTENNQN
jgi:hypothetical protein